MRLSVCLIAVLLPLLVDGATDLPERFAASFAVSNDGTQLGETYWSLERQGRNHYRFESVTRASGLVSLFLSGERRETSIWHYRDGSLQPLSYRYRRTGHKARQVDVAFDWERGVANNTVSGKTWALEVGPKTVDKLLYLLVLMQDLRAGKTDLSYSVADGGRLKTYRLDILGTETLQTALGPLVTVKVQRHGAKGNRVTTLWCAPSLQYLPVQVESREGDEITTMRLESTEGLSTEGRKPLSGQAAP